MSGISFNEAQLKYLEKLIRFHSDDPSEGFNVEGDVLGDVEGGIFGNVWCDINGDVQGDVFGSVWGTIGKGQDDE